MPLGLGHGRRCEQSRYADRGQDDLQIRCHVNLVCLIVRLTNTYPMIHDAQRFLIINESCQKYIVFTEP